MPAIESKMQMFGRTVLQSKDYLIFFLMLQSLKRRFYVNDDQQSGTVSNCATR